MYLVVDITKGPIKHRRRYTHEIHHDTSLIPFPEGQGHMVSMAWSTKLNFRPKHWCSTARRVGCEGVLQLSAECCSKRRRRDLTSAASNRDSRSHATMGPQAAKKLHDQKESTKHFKKTYQDYQDISRHTTPSQSARSRKKRRGAKLLQVQEIFPWSILHCSLQITELVALKPGPHSKPNTLDQRTTQNSIEIGPSSMDFYCPFCFFSLRRH